MSHFCVGVIVDKDKPIMEEVEEILAPYYEGLEVKPYVRRKKDDIIRDMIELQESFQNKNNDELEEEDLFLKCAETEEEYLKYYAEYWTECELDEDGNELTTYNPNSKWDWWTVGGRWSDMLFDKSHCNMTDWCKIEDIDFNRCSHMSAEDAIYEWEVAVEELHKGEQKADDLFIPYKPEHYLERYGNKENFVNIKSTFTLYAIVDKENWYQKGQMGWFGCDDATLESELEYIEKFKQYMSDENNKEKILVVVDCHI